MTTILKDFEITGKSLMKNRESSVHVVPSNNGEIRFFVEKSSEPIIAHVDNVVATNHCIVLGNNKNKIMLTEHFIAACALLGIDSLDVYVSKSEMHILDGSTKVWVEKFTQAEIE